MVGTISLFLGSVVRSMVVLPSILMLQIARLLALCGLSSLALVIVPLLLRDLLMHWLFADTE
jgi:hypothetical protein